MMIEYHLANYLQEAMLELVNDMVHDSKQALYVLRSYASKLYHHQHRSILPLPLL